jgi:hypothetical protein
MHCALVVAFALTASPLTAQDPPPIVIDGLKALVRSGIDTAVVVWMKGSPVQDDTASAARITDAFAKLPDWFGKPIGFDILKTYLLGTHFKRTYSMVLFEGGPLFFRFDYYLGSRGWAMQHLDFNTDRAKLLPDALLPP